MKNAFKVIGILFGIIVAILIIFVLTLYYLFGSMARLPEGEFLKEATSPTGAYTVRAYLTNGGATTAYAVRGEVVYHKKNDKTKNIYWQYREQRAEIFWLDDTTISINGIELDVRKEVYDYRKQ